jgi:hypothetical protein
LLPWLPRLAPSPTAWTADSLFTVGPTSKHLLAFGAGLYLISIATAMILDLAFTFVDVATFRVSLLPAVVSQILLTLYHLDPDRRSETPSRCFLRRGQYPNILHRMGLCSLLVRHDVDRMLILATW